MKKLITRIIGLFCFLAILSSVSISAFGYDSISVQPAETEIVSLREINTKHFRLSDGTYRADVYSYPIHYWSDDFGWLDIDTNSSSTSTRAVILPVLPDPGATSQVIFDTQISSENPNVNYGGATNISASRTSTPFFNINIPALPNYASISSATLELKYYFNNETATSYATLGVYRILNEWEEYEVTFNSMSNFSNQGIHGMKISEKWLYTSDNATQNSPQTVVFDITAAAQHWYGFVQETYGIAIKYMSGTAENVNFCTYENSVSNRAKFTFNYSLWEVDSQDSTAVNERQSLWDAGIRKVKVSGVEYFDYTIPIENFLRSTIQQCESNRCVNDTWLSVYPSFYWFYTKVNNQRAWDLKHQPSWNNAFPNVPYISTFVYKNQIMTPEDLGNFAYGYNGRAMCFGPVTLYWGGGVAAQGSLTAPETKMAPLYGDSRQDHNNIEMGINYFQYDYPGYYSVSYNQIPDEEWILTLGNLILTPEN